MPGALITGASKGLGRHIAYALGSEGCAVAAGYYTDERGANETIATIAKNHVRAMPVRIDVTNPQSIQDAVAAVEVNQSSRGTINRYAERELVTSCILRSIPRSESGRCKQVLQVEEHKNSVRLWHSCINGL